MPPRAFSAEFSRHYGALPPSAQQSLVEKHLIPLLNLTNKRKARRILRTASRSVRAHKNKNIPHLDIQAKKFEVNSLIDELSRDMKCSFVKGASNRETLLQEIFESLAEWLSDAWCLVYEYKMDFTKAHAALLFSIGVLDHVQTMRGGSSCKCATRSIYIPVTLKSRSGRVVKSFTEMGVENLETAILWIWRDLFLSLLSVESKALMKVLPDLLMDIDDLVGWEGLEKILCGGKSYDAAYEDALDEMDDEEGDEDESDAEYTDGDEDSDTYSEEPIERKIFQSPYWPHKICSQLPKFLPILHTRLMTIFKSSPSPALFHSINSINASPFTIIELHNALADLAPCSPISLTVALQIHAEEGSAQTIAALLDSHSHLLRPRDAPSLQSAAQALARVPKFRARALALIEAELIDTAHGIHAALLQNHFSRIDVSSVRSGFQGIQRLRHGTTARSDAVERWVDSAQTPGVMPMNPIAFAAMMMGLPPGAADPDDADPMGVLDVDPEDSDYAELREDMRPGMKARFEGWTDVAECITGGVAVLMKVFTQVLEIMPFLKAHDVVEEMIGRLADKPSKHYLCDALDVLNNFVKTQKKRAAAALKTKKAKESKASFNFGTINAPGGSYPPPMPPPPALVGAGGMEDVD
ncbi:hypothetical protein BD410DRAFT_806555 [Rickenella mellea]|uniref:Uncharacterized protein n=1 Tax=Rickenella mellea TaxID=50990 RepID=A0A4Y7PSK6_9AGAM|nr:hypothetical protein BD410DRAFT_806555 [Rickenella mellea]